MAGAPPIPQSASWHAAANSLLGRLEPNTAAKLAAYRDLILSWNRQFNLTALRSAEEIDSRLILESMRLSELLQYRLGGRLRGASIVDIGSGSGIPGIPLGVLNPGVKVIMVEATGKKARFIEQAIASLDLQNAGVEHARAEDLARIADFRESFDVAVARAVGSISTLLELSMPFLKVGGSAFLPKGELEDAEISGARAAALELGAGVPEVVMLPDIPGCPFTQVVVADKIERIPARYPRRAGIPAREPLKG